jgi:hypothetical protein
MVMRAKTCKKLQTGESGCAIREIQNVVSEGNVKKILVQIGANYREMVRIGARRFDGWGEKNVGLIRFK